MSELSMNMMNGCGPFWIANSMTSAYLGKINRDKQFEISKESEEFQLEMEHARNRVQDKIEAEKIAFQRCMMKLQREYCREERNMQAANLERSVEVSFFAAQWPLALPVHTILEELKNEQRSLNVILLHTPLIAGVKGQIVGRENYIVKRELELYDGLEQSVYKDFELNTDVYVRRGAHTKEKCSSADIMNIHFLMGNIPTLVIMLKHQDNRIYFTVAMWDEQAERPLIRPLFAIPHDSILARENEKYCSKMVEKLHYTISIITGAIRDQYAMLTWGNLPILPNLLQKEGNENMKRYALENKGIYNFLQQENNSTREALSGQNPDLLQVYAQADVNNMLCLLDKQNEVFHS